MASRPPLLNLLASARVACSHAARSRSAFISASRAQSSAAGGAAPSSYSIRGQTYERDAWSNAPPTILDKVGRNLHEQPAHPIGIIRSIIESHFPQHASVTPSTPIVTVHQNFDELGFAPDHPGRSLTDSYYLNTENMLRTHTSAHEVETYRTGQDRWLLTADVYRRDEIDSSHYPVFHQMEGTHIWPQDKLDQLTELNRALAAQLADCPLVIEDGTRISDSNPYQACHDPAHAAEITQHLKHSLNSLIFRLFGHTTEDGEPLRVRWIEAFFPFTTPSYEVEVWWKGQWLEVLGCGVVMQKTLDQAGQSHKAGWAFGLGLERLSMVLFSIPDIRLFWSKDERFLSQFSANTISTFKPYSKYPPCYKDMSFWLPQGARTDEGGSMAGGLEVQGDKEASQRIVETGPKVFHENDYCEIVREVAGDLVENVTLIDEFTHPKTGRQSKAYRINYRSMDRSLSNEEVNALQAQVEKRVVQEMALEIR